jgi:hypothetical protein
MSRRPSDSLIFDSLRLEGSLFVPSILEKAAHGELQDQRSPSDYRLPAGISLADEQGRAFRIASSLALTHLSSAPGSETLRSSLAFTRDFLRDALGYSDISICELPIGIGDRSFPITAFAGQHRIPVVVAPATLDLDSPHECFAISGTGARRRSAHQLAQQFLNASPDCSWAIVTNGRQLRLIRDADTLTRPAYLEADLDIILKEQRYPDFAAVWRLFHASRAGSPSLPTSWDSWRQQGIDQGERVRDGLRAGVTQALLAFGSGFLAHPANDNLRSRIQAGDLSVDAYFQQLLRLIYRCLFLFTAEERGLLHSDNPDPADRRARDTYTLGYSFRRLRDRSLRRSGFDRHHDLWTGCRVVFKGLTLGEPLLALPALGGLFAHAQCPDIDAAHLENRALLDAMFQLRWSSQGGSLTPIDYRNRGPEELGSVYESLLELVPSIDLPSRSFGFVGLTTVGSTEGNARKTSGSYYTQDPLVQELIRSALDPVIDRAQNLASALALQPWASLPQHARSAFAHAISQPSDSPDLPRLWSDSPPHSRTSILSAQALLSLTIIDPACGSGHFLLAAARRIAERLAEIRAVDGAVTPRDYRRALREVIAHCIHGVDRNPMAIELARTALWLEGFEPGLPLSFLDHRLVCGDALLGLISFQSLTAGIPAEAFKPLTGDDKAACKALASTNRVALKSFERRRIDPEFFREADTRNLLNELSTMEAMPESSPTEVEAKAAAYTAFLQHTRDSRLAQAADLVVAAFLSPKDTAANASLCPTTQSLGDLLFPIQGNAVRPEILQNARDICRHARVLHWPLAFAGIFARGGFDCVLGNPPWERIKLQEQEFFASRHPDIATAPNAAARQRLIAGLAQGSTADQRLFQEFTVAKRLAEAASIFMHVPGEDGGRFPLTGVGDVNTYALFAETISSMTHRDGRSGFIVPTGIATDDSTKAFFAHLAEGGRLTSLYDYENREKLFPAVDSRMKFCLMTLGPAEAAEFAFFLTQPAQLHSSQGAFRRFALTGEEFQLINPNTRTCPVFRSQADAELTKKIYRHVPVLINEAKENQPEQNPWGISFSRMIDMANDSGLFLDAKSPTSLPLYEAKMIHQFDHRWATYRWDSTERKVVTDDVTDSHKEDPAFTVQPRYWIEERHVLSRLARVPRCIIRAWDTETAEALQAALATWIVAAESLHSINFGSSRQLVIDLAGPLFSSLPSDESAWLDSKAFKECLNWPPLSPHELATLRNSSDLVSAAHSILDQRSPRWLMGWRDITNATNERTVIASVVPRAGCGDTLLLMFPSQPAPLTACLLADQNSLIHDYVARQKIGGTHLKYHVKKQIVNLPPSAYREADIAYIVPRVLELTYTAHDLRAWAEDLGYSGPPFRFDPHRRAELRADLDAHYASLYGLTRDELRYILDPLDTHGLDYPTETFRGLKSNELRAFGEYRTRRLILAAWDHQATLHAGRLRPAP